MTNGKLVNSYTLNTNDKSPIVGFEIITCRELNDYEGGTIIEQIKTAEDFLNTDEFGLDEPFYRVFAVYKKDYHKSRKAISDFYNVKEAVTFIQELSGNRVDIYSY